MLSYKRRICSDTPRWPELVWLNRFPQAAYRPRDVAKQREPARSNDQLERQFRGGFQAFAQVSGLGCIDLGDRRSRVQISAARQTAELLHAEASNPRVSARTAVRIPRDWHIQLGVQAQDLPARIYT